MNDKLLGRTGVRVSELCLGCMTLGDEADEPTSVRMIERALDAGINFFDTANVYASGRSEEIVGQALKSRRNSVVIATKARGRVGDGPNDEGLSRYHLMHQLEISLRKLQTDRIDLYQVHRWDDSLPIEETLRALDDMVRQGKVLYIGCSNFAAWQLAKSLWKSDKLGLARFESLQPRYNLIDRAIETELLPLCLDQQIGVMVYSPLAGGILTGKYRQGEPFPPGTRGAESELFRRIRALPHNLERGQKLAGMLKELPRPPVQSAIAWTLGHPAVTSAIIGARNPEQLEWILNDWPGPLPPEEQKLLNEASQPPPIN